MDFFRQIDFHATVCDRKRTHFRKTAFKMATLATNVALTRPLQPAAHDSHHLRTQCNGQIVFVEKICHVGALGFAGTQTYCC